MKSDCSESHSLDNDKMDPWLVEKQADLLAEYYFKLKQVADVQRVLQIEEKAFLQSKAKGLQLMGNLNLLYQKYKHFQLNDEADKLSKVIQSLGGDVLKEMTPHKYEFTIPKEIIQQYEGLFGPKAENNEKTLDSVCVLFLSQ